MSASDVFWALVVLAFAYELGRVLLLENLE